MNNDGWIEKRKYLKRVLKCDRCKPHRHDNVDGRVPKTDKYKSKRKGR